MLPPLPPFDDWTLQIREPGLGYAWVGKPGYLRGAAAVLPADVNPMFKMAIQAANMFTALALSRKVELSADIDAVMHEHGVHAPRPLSLFPGM